MGVKQAKLKIKGARVSQGYTQQKLGKLIGCGQSSVSRLEQDVLSASFGDVLQLCKLLHIDIAELVSEVDK